MNTSDYQQFLGTVRDTIATWISEPSICGLFAADMEELEQRYHEYIEERQRWSSKQDTFLHSTEGLEWGQKWIHGPAESERERIEPPREMREPEPECPLDRFRKYETCPLTVNDYRVLLGVVHDGVTWHEHDRRRYICPDLRREGTIVDLLFRAGTFNIGYEPHYRPLIQEALDVVTKDIQGQVIPTNAGCMSPADLAKREPKGGETWGIEKPPAPLGERLTNSATPEAEHREGTWSGPMKKAEIMQKLGIDSYKKLDSCCRTGTYEMRPAGDGTNRQLWEIRIDTLDAHVRSKFER